MDKAGKLVIDDSFYKLIIKSKQRSVLYGEWQLSLLPSIPDYPVLSNVNTMRWWPLDAFDGDAPWQEMLSTVCEHYKDDVGFNIFEKRCNSGNRSNTVVN